MTPEQLTKLPKYAQEYIAKLRRQRDSAVARLDGYEDNQTPSNIWTEEYCFDGGDNGNNFTRRQYIQSDRVLFKNKGVALEVSCRGDEGIKLSWGPEKPWGPWGLGDIALVPTSYQQIRLTNIVYDEHELDRLNAMKERSKQ